MWWQNYCMQWEIWGEYRRKLQTMRPELRARACLSYRQYVRAVYWLHKMLRPAIADRFEREIERLRAKIVLILEWHLKEMMLDKKITMSHWPSGAGNRIDISIISYFGNPLTIQGLPFIDERFEEIGNCALHEIGGLDLAVKAFALRGLKIPDTELLHYAQLCANELKFDECKRACALMKETNPLQAYQQCVGPIIETTNTPKT